MTAKWQQRLSSAIPVILVLIFVLLGYAWVTSQRRATENQMLVVKTNAYWTACQSRFNKATQQRSALLTKYSTLQRQATKAEHDAMTYLVTVRGLPNDTRVIEARDAWLDAGRKWEKATWMVDEANRLNPVLLFEDFCKPVKGVKPPKVPPAKTPDPSMYPGPQNPFLQ